MRNYTEQENPLLAKAIYDKNLDTIEKMSIHRKEFRFGDSIYFIIAMEIDVTFLKALKLNSTEAIYQLATYITTKKLKLEVVEYLWSLGIDTTSFNEKYKMFRDSVFLTNSEKCFDFFLKKGFDPDVLGVYLRDAMNPPLRLNPIKKSVQKLLSAGANVNKICTIGGTRFPPAFPLSEAIISNEIFDILLNAGADPKIIFMGKSLQSHALSSFWKASQIYDDDTVCSSIANNFNKLQSLNPVNINELEIPREQIDHNRLKRDLPEIYFYISKSWYETLSDGVPKLATVVEWLDDSMYAEQAVSIPGDWFYNTREVNKDGQIIRVYNSKLLDKIVNKRNPYTNQQWDSSVLKKFSIGGPRRENSVGGRDKQYHQYKNRKYLVRYGPRGGRYILAKGQKTKIN